MTRAETLQSAFSGPLSALIRLLGFPSEFCLVAPPGVEPGRPFGLRILNPLRLPFRQGARDAHCCRFAPRRKAHEHLRCF
jgi:hypothetical protein